MEPIKTSLSRVSSLLRAWALEIASVNGMAISTEHERQLTKPYETASERTLVISPPPLGVLDMQYALRIKLFGHLAHKPQSLQLCVVL